MGLSAPKRRTKLANDPNNTAWSKSTTGFGHKIMSQQGWKPGDYLGARNASHADHYTAANASHIRVLLREDNLGLGAQLGGGGGNNAETFGLSLFAGVLGRLNGKSDVEVEKQTNAIRDAEVRSYQQRKYGFMNFVRGGLLVGDEMRPAETLVGRPEGEGELASKMKRKLDDVDDQTENVKESKKSKKRSCALESEPDAQTQVQESAVASSKKSKKRKGDRLDQTNEPEGSNDTADSAVATKKKKRSKSSRDVSSDDKSISKSKEEKARLKAEKAARKEQRRKRKEERRRDKAPDAKAVQSPSEVDSSAGEAPQAEKTPAESAFGGSRHAVRQRYIQQKRMASMNAQAMKEIFMLQASA